MTAIFQMIISPHSICIMPSTLTEIAARHGLITNWNGSRRNDLRFPTNHDCLLEFLFYTSHPRTDNDFICRYRLLPSRSISTITFDGRVLSNVTSKNGMVNNKSPSRHLENYSIGSKIFVCIICNWRLYLQFCCICQIAVHLRKEKNNDCR